MSRPFTPDDLVQIQALMEQSINAGQPFIREDLEREEGQTLFADQPYKLEIIEGIPDAETLSVYRHGALLTSARGPIWTPPGIYLR